jgi:hypothetical protein
VSFYGSPAGVIFCILGLDTLELTPSKVNLPNRRIIAILNYKLGLDMTKQLHLVKLSVGSEGIDGLRAWQSSPPAQGPDGLPRHITRMWPKQEKKLLDGGSIYWVIKRLIQCRQRILRLDEVIGGDGIRRCAIVLDPELILTTQVPRRPFQGWRYLKGEDAPLDLNKARASEEPLPPELAGKLAEIGVL